MTGTSSGKHWSRRTVLKGMATLAAVGPQIGARGSIMAAETPHLRVRLTGDLSQLDPALVFDPSSHYVANAIYSRLVRYRPGTSQLEGDLATAWATSPDGRTLTFQLRRNVQWHRGFGPLTAGDVQYSYERHRDPATKSLFAGAFREVERVEAPDDHTVRIVLKQPAPPFLTSALPFRGGWIISRKAMERFGQDYVRNAVGTGPYVLDHWTPGKEVVLVANPQFYGGVPSIRRVTFLPVSDDAIVELALRTRELDLAEIRSAEVFTRLAANPSLQTHAKLGLRVYLLVLNMRRKPLDSMAVRRAIFHAVDREAVVKAVFNGLASKGTGILNPNYLFHTEQVRQYDYDPGRAKQYLADAGLPDGFDISIHYFTERPYPDIVPLLQANLKAVGIRLQLKPLEFAAFQQVRRAGEYDMLSATPSRPPDPDALFTEFFHSRSFPPRSNSAYYSAADELIDRARSASDLGQRAALYAEVQQRIADDVPVVPLAHEFTLWAMQGYVKDFPGVTLNDIPLQVLTLAK